MLGSQKARKLERFEVRNNLAHQPIKPSSFPASRPSSSIGAIAWLFYEKCLAFVKQWILKQQISLKCLLEEFSAKTQGIGEDFHAAELR